MARRVGLLVGLLAAVVGVWASRPRTDRTPDDDDARVWQWDIPDGPAGPVALAVRTQVFADDGPADPDEREEVVWADTGPRPRVTAQWLDLRNIGVLTDGVPYRLSGGVRPADGLRQPWAAAVGGHTMISVTTHPADRWAGGELPLLTVETFGTDGRFVHTLVFVAGPKSR